MRVRVMIDGRPEWIDHGPSQASLKGIRGALVQGEPGPVELDRILKRQRRAEKVAA